MVAIGVGGGIGVEVVVELGAIVEGPFVLTAGMHWLKSSARVSMILKMLRNHLQGL